MIKRGGMVGKERRRSRSREEQDEREKGERRGGRKWDKEEE